eukprot:TRINITY_DN20569_c1_g1_i1.p1 TRINITY_DN20569_c1_g1~~TRINITY_DN20569_c1_g1_i1.p1  ORF type:complete len:419 (+),score=98.38 TRINITY_DN20569_c1_g1_i1:68-1258(+)
MSSSSNDRRPPERHGVFATATTAAITATAATETATTTTTATATGATTATTAPLQLREVTQPSDLTQNWLEKLVDPESEKESASESGSELPSDPGVVFRNRFVDLDAHRANEYARRRSLSWSAGSSSRSATENTTSSSDSVQKRSEKALDGGQASGSQASGGWKAATTFDDADLLDWCENPTGQDVNPPPQQMPQVARGAQATASSVSLKLCSKPVCRPCRFWQNGKCRDGDECDYCHHPGKKARTRPCKTARNACKQMAAAIAATAEDNSDVAKRVATQMSQTNPYLRRLLTNQRKGDSAPSSVPFVPDEGQRSRHAAAAGARVVEAALSVYSAATETTESLLSSKGKLGKGLSLKGSPTSPTEMVSAHQTHGGHKGYPRAGSKGKGQAGDHKMSL